MEPNINQDNNQAPASPDMAGPVQPAPQSVPEPQTTQPPKPQKSKTLIVLVVIFALLTITGTAFGIWAVLNNNQKPASQPEPSEPSEPTEPSKPTNEEVELTDTYIKRDLDQKIAILHRTDQTASTITIEHLHPEMALYTNGDLSNAAKLSQVVLTLANTSAAVTVTTDIANSILANFSKEFYGEDLSGVQNELKGYTFAKNTVDQKHREVFGTDPVYEQDATYCPMTYYDNSGYYFILNRCGGDSPIVAYYYKNRYTTDDDHAYVYINAGAANGANSKIYCEIQPYGPESYSDASSACGDYSGDKSTIDATNHDKFAEYRFVFTKATDGTYYFEKVEKVSK